MRRCNIKGRLLIGVGCLILPLMLGGCFDIEQGIKLNEDMSGEAKLKIGIDFEPMAVIMTAIKHSMEGKEGAPSKEEIEAAKREMMAEMQNDPSTSEFDIEDARKDLPEGIELFDASVKQDGMKVVTLMHFGFDKVQRLKELNLKKSPEGETAGGPPNPMESPIDTPFGDLEVDDDGTFVTIRSKPNDPTKSVKEETSEGPGAGDPEMEQMMEDAFRGLRIAWNIEAPFEVVEHNATRKEGKKLYWEYTYDSIKAMEAKGQGEPEPIFVKYKK
jgi:hypothetical protein